MYVPDFDYYSPSTLEEACGVLGGLGEGARVLAGGTDLLHMMKNELLAPKALVSLKNIRNLGEIKYDPGKGVVLGARATHNDLVNSLLLQQKYPAVPETAHQMANNQVRNLGTVGGNLVNAVPSADLPPILIALRAYVNLVSPRGKRTMDLEDFFLGPRKTAIGRDEILTSVVIPDQPSTGSWYCKFGLRRSGALAVVGVAVSVVADGLHVQSGRIVLGAVYPTPLRAKEAERLLAGGIATEALLEEVGRAAAAECRPISDTRASDEYRRDMVRVFTKRALRKALKIEGATTE
ncbi:MAG: aerobic-type carbon monoxide dehydrogenase, middle subunit CoxM/CutM-like protein [Deltaproteobacteria bacterium]|nr:aerobic-type carbon monoxide dehydrogenase, middle subunit CoxM/CutM-like protein [Deltaproteobacteria bacterium]